MLEFIICEDELLAQDKIQSCIHSTMSDLDDSLRNNSTYYDICCYPHYTANLVEKIKNTHPKIYIIDLELKDTLNGFDITRIIRDHDTSSTVIILTVTNGLQGEAFKHRLKIMDYITKDKNCFLRLKETFILAIQEMQQTYLFFQAGNSALSVKLSDIIYINRITKERKSQITLNNGTTLKTSLTLDQLMPKLDHRFFRTHQSYIINLDYIDSVNFDNENILFRTGIILPCLSRQRKKELREFIEKNWKGVLPYDKC